MTSLGNHLMNGCFLLSLTTVGWASSGLVSAKTETTFPPGWADHIMQESLQDVRDNGRHFRNRASLEGGRQIAYRLDQKHFKSNQERIEMAFTLRPEFPHQEEVRNYLAFAKEACFSNSGFDGVTSWRKRCPQIRNRALALVHGLIEAGQLSDNQKWILAVMLNDTEYWTRFNFAWLAWKPGVSLHGGVVGMFLLALVLDYIPEEETRKSFSAIHQSLQ